MVVGSTRVGESEPFLQQEGAGGREGRVGRGERFVGGLLSSFSGVVQI